MGEAVGHCGYATALRHGLIDHSARERERVCERQSEPLVDARRMQLGLPVGLPGAKHVPPQSGFGRGLAEGSGLHPDLEPLFVPSGQNEPALPQRNDGQPEPQEIGRPKRLTGADLPLQHCNRAVEESLCPSFERTMMSPPGEDSPVPKGQAGSPNVPLAGFPCPRRSVGVSGELSPIDAPMDILPGSISQFRISPCTQGRAVPIGAARGGHTKPPRSGFLPADQFETKPAQTCQRLTGGYFGPC